MSEKPPFGMAVGRFKLTPLPNKGFLVRHVLTLPGNESGIVYGKDGPLQNLKNLEGGHVLIIFFRRKEGKKTIFRIKAIYYDDPRLENRGWFLEAVWTLGPIIAQERMPSDRELTSDEFLEPHYLV